MVIRSSFLVVTTMLVGMAFGQKYVPGHYTPQSKYVPGHTTKSGKWVEGHQTKPSKWVEGHTTKPPKPKSPFPKLPTYKPKKF